MDAGPNIFLLFGTSQENCFDRGEYLTDFSNSKWLVVLSVNKNARFYTWP
ncbi:hypothetical protein SAMN04487996_104418 [Dyadobacter soli]|uniref:Uncharacterized protein n=1 Tax=Dyadobacter soli TaxID=659014 RepID=A0A1G7C8B7_9BACT|nr:hypothetical protein SAMN04487996_104418 [Dyadobacter soli]